MSTLTPFAYGDHPVRVVTIAGEPWFVLTDLCSVPDERHDPRAGSYQAGH